MGNCIICNNIPNVYIPIEEDEIYKSPDSTFITTFGSIPEIVPPTPFISSEISR